MHSWSRQTCEMQEKAAMRQTFKKKKFARQLHISEACRSGCKLHLERSPPHADAHRRRLRLWRSNEWEVGGGSLGEPRKPKRKRPQQLAAPRISLQAADLAGLRTPGLLVFVLTSYATYRQRLAHYKAPGSKLHRRLISLSRGPNFVRQPCNNVWLSH